jgi:hypothetical protein
MAQATQITPQQAAQMNLQARALVLGNAVNMIQQIASISVDPASQPVVNIAPRNVGLIKGFIVEVNGTIANTGMTTAATLTGFGAWNVLSNIVFQDLNNQTRIQTTGWHIALLNSAKQGFGFGGAYAPNLPADFGNNWTVQSAPASIAAGASSAVRQIYYVPLAYSAADLRGAIYANVVNATMNLQLTVNATPVAASGDPVPEVYVGNTGGWSGNVTVTVYQVYLDQLPFANTDQGRVPVLPAQDLSTIYELKQTTLTGMAQNQDFPYAYANFRDFLSTTAVYNRAGTLGTGADVNYWSLTSANFTNLFKFTPEIAALYARSVFMADPPDGCYFFDHMALTGRTINTVQFGNMELNLNAATIATGGSLLVGTEAFANVTMLTGASSLSAG